MKRMEVSCVLKHLWKPFGMAYPIAILWTWVLLGPYSHGLINVLSLIQSGAVWTDFVGTVNGAILRPGLGSNIWLSRGRIMCQFFSIFEVSWRSYKDVNKDHGILMLTGSGRKNVRRWFEMVGNQRWRQIALTDCLVGLRLANWGCANGPWIYTIIRENASKIFRSNYMRSLLHHRQNRPGQRGWHFGQNSRRCIRMRIFSGQRSKVTWAQEGDHDTIFFHSAATSKKINSTIHGLLNQNGMWCEEDRDIGGIITSYCRELFQSSIPMSLRLMRCWRTWAQGWPRRWIPSSRFPFPMTRYFMPFLTWLLSGGGWFPCYFFPKILASYKFEYYYLCAWFSQFAPPASSFELHFLLSLFLRLLNGWDDNWARTN